MRVLGIDPGTKSVGVALWDSQLPDNEALLTWDILRARDDKKQWVGRIAWLSIDLGYWLGDLKYEGFAKPAMAVIELPTRNYQTIVQLAWACGEFSHTCGTYGIARVDPIPAQDVKDYLGIKRCTRRELVKPRILDYVNMRFGLSLGEDEQDAADAIAIAVAGWQAWHEQQLREGE
jgi:Holliday junction resolvasome RuvABC endonuclease subunit